MLFKKKKPATMAELLAEMEKANKKLDRIQAGLEKDVARKVEILKRVKA